MKSPVSYVSISEFTGVYPDIWNIGARYAQYDNDVPPKASEVRTIRSTRNLNENEHFLISFFPFVLFCLFVFCNVFQHCTLSFGSSSNHSKEMVAKSSLTDPPADYSHVLFVVCSDQF